MAVEQIIHMEVSGILQRLFVLLALHYVYDIEYHSRMKDFYHFLESKLLKMTVHIIIVPHILILFLRWRII